ncbi:MAG: SMC-Scp complex subunit ScpB [Clostridia bacterium]|nr:SMC-Scp complex subunit ScpB [Clostridia bacterium]
MEEKKEATPYLEQLTSAQDIEQAIEAILYAAGYPMRYDKLAEVLNLTVKDIKTVVKEMAAHFAEDSTHHGIQLLLYPTTCQLATKERYAPYIREALGIRRGGNLSASSMEVLAVVAYNQPVTRSYIDLVRGVDSSYAVNSLLDKGLIEAAGRLDAPGRPMLYVTTDKFLRVFGINNLDELPETEALSVAAAQVEEIPENAEQLAAEIPDGTEPREYTEPVDTEEAEVIYENGSAVQTLPVAQSEEKEDDIN